MTRTKHPDASITELLVSEAALLEQRQALEIEIHRVRRELRTLQTQEISERFGLPQFHIANLNELKRGTAFIAEAAKQEHGVILGERNCKSDRAILFRPDPQIECDRVLSVGGIRYGIMDTFEWIHGGQRLLISSQDSRLPPEDPRNKLGALTPLTPAAEILWIAFKEERRKLAAKN